MCLSKWSYTEKVTIEPSVEGGEEVNYVAIWRKIISWGEGGRGTESASALRQKHGYNVYKNQEEQRVSGVA